MGRARTTKRRSRPKRKHAEILVRSEATRAIVVAEASPRSVSANHQQSTGHTASSLSRRGESESSLSPPDSASTPTRTDNLGVQSQYRFRRRYLFWLAAILWVLYLQAGKTTGPRVAQCPEPDREDDRVEPRIQEEEVFFELKAGRKKVRTSDVRRPSLPDAGVSGSAK